MKPDQPRNFSAFDHWLSGVDYALKAMTGVLALSRPNPAQEVPDMVLDEVDRKKSAELMRVNYAGEVCAQALYQGQSLTTQEPNVRSMLLKAAMEEIDHLVWCKTRLYELESYTSYLNFFWYGGSFLMGIFVGLFPNPVNLGFVAETERQVGLHLNQHLQELPTKDLRSQAILSQMQLDEAKHETQAREEGGEMLPMPIQRLMKLTSKVMTVTARWV